MIIFPETVLKKLLDYLIGEYVTPEYLQKVLGDNSLGTYKYAENAIEIFDMEEDNPRKVETHIFFHKDRAELPTIHINMYSDMPGGSDGIGFDPHYNELGEMQYRRDFATRFSIVFTSNNTFEVLIMYNVIKALVIGANPLFELNGLKNMKLSGGDLQLNDSLMPLDIYVRGFNIDCSYNYIVPSLIDENQTIEDPEVQVNSNCYKDQ